MATIYDAIKGEIQTSDEYLADDPFYNAGAKLRQAQLQPETNSQAIWGPIVQALIGGVLTGIGKKRARETEFDAYKASGLQEALAANLVGTEGTEGFGPVASGDTYGKNIPILNSVYMQEDAPKGWTGATGKRDLLKALVQQEAAAKQDESLFQKGLKVGPNGEIAAVPGFAEAIAKQEGLVDAAKYKAKKDAEGTKPPMDRVLEGISLLPEKMQGPALKEYEDTKKFNESIPKIREMMKTAYDAAQKAKGLKGVWPFEGISITDEQTARDVAEANIFAQVAAVVPGILTDKDAKRTVDKFITGMWDSPKALETKTAGLLDFMQKNVSSAPILEGSGLMKRDSISAAPATTGGIPEGAVPVPGKVQKGTGKQVYMLNGKMWVP